MENRVNILLNEIKVSRERIINLVVNINANDGANRLAKDQWSIQEIIEHLVLAERGGFDLIYTASENFRLGKPVWSGNSENSGLSIEEILVGSPESRPSGIVARETGKAAGGFGAGSL